MFPVVSSDACIERLSTLYRESLTVAIAILTVQELLISESASLVSYSRDANLGIVFPALPHARAQGAYSNEKR